MVYIDISAAKIDNNSNLHQSFYKASVIDRCFSFLIDYLILSPVISFVLLVLFQTEIVMWKSGGSASLSRYENLPILILLGFSYIVLFSLIQSFFIYFFQATPGQHFLKLQTQVDKSSGLVFFRIMLRQVSFWFSCFFLGLPWLAILAHPQQKTFYDRLSEAAVVSLKANQYYYSFEVETKYWRSLLATLVLFVSFLLSASIWLQHGKIKNSAYTFNQLNKERHFCSELKSVELSERLQTAIALNLVGQLSDACVDKEADFALWTMHNDELKSLAYYAKSLTSDDIRQEQKYLQQACDFKGASFFGCTVANAFRTNDLATFYKTLRKTEKKRNFLSSVLQYELGNVLNQTEHYQENFKGMKKFDSLVVVKKYLISEVLGRSQIKSEFKQTRRPAGLEIKNNANEDGDFEYAQKLIEDL
ncbi:MAG: RDD family protein [Pseudobdellovibrio sp.]